MEPTHRTLGLRRSAALAAVAAAAALALPAAANAAVTGAVTGDTAVLTGDRRERHHHHQRERRDLRHNLTARLRDSRIDFDSTQAGDQTLTAAAAR